MEILIYLEAHPIRNSYFNYYSIVNQFIDMLENEPHTKDIKILVSEKISQKLKKERKETFFYNNLLLLSDDEEKQIENYFSDWDKESIALWQNILDGEGSVSSFYEEILNRVYKNVYQFDVVLYWGTNGAVKNFAKANDLPAIAMEQGCVREPFFESMYFDFIGVNGNAYTSLIDITKIDLNEEKTISDIFFTKEEVGLFLKSKYSKLIEQNLNINVLIPLQLADDANIIQYSKYNSMIEVLIDVLPRLNKAGYICYIKPHPGNVDSAYNLDDHTQCKIFIEKFKNVYWLDDVDYYGYIPLLSKMKAIVSVNSSVGFESMLLKKIVIPLGKSPYNLSLSLPTIDDLCANNIDMLAYNKRILTITRLLLYNYLHFKKDGFTLKTFYKAIELNIKLNDLYNKDNNSCVEYILSNDIYNPLDYKDIQKEKSLFDYYLYKFKTKIKQSSLLYSFIRYIKKG